MPPPYPINRQLLFIFCIEQILYKAHCDKKTMGVNELSSAPLIAFMS